MKTFSQEHFDAFIVENDVIGFFDTAVKLKSGRVSNWYVNWRTATEDVFLIDRISDHVLQFFKANDDILGNADTIIGVPEGATKLGMLCQYKWARNASNFSHGSHSLAMGRAKPKEHGDPKDKFFVGAPRGNTVVIEDVTTTGGSLINFIDSLLDSNVRVTAAVGLTNRMEIRDDGKSVEEAIAERKCEGRSIPYLSMSQANHLLPKSIAKHLPTDDIVLSIVQEFEEYGAEKLVL